MRKESLRFDCVLVPLPSRASIAARPAYFAHQRQVNAVGYIEASRAANREKSTSSDTGKGKGREIVIDGEPGEDLRKHLKAGVEAINGFAEADNDPELSHTNHKTFGRSDSVQDTSMAITIQDSSDEESAMPSRRGKLGKVRQAPSTPGSDEDATLGPDDEILRILGRRKVAKDVYKYHVRLSDGRHIVVSMSTCLVNKSKQI